MYGMNVVPKDHNHHHSSASAPRCGCALESSKIPITGSLSSLGFSTHPVSIFITHPNSFVPCGVRSPATLHFSLPSLVFFHKPVKTHDPSIQSRLDMCSTSLPFYSSLLARPLPWLNQTNTHVFYHCI